MRREGNKQQCPLCHSGCRENPFYSDLRREFYRCRRCFLIFVPPVYFLSSEEEKAEYDKHQNSPDDQGYRRFLSGLFEPLQQRVSAGAGGLDFGSGPGPTLSVMFQEAGYKMTLYDPFYAPDTTVLKSLYDFVTASEVVEHFHNPANEMALLWSLLKPGGWLGIMTGMALDRQAFAGWRYKNDRSHVVFFSKETMKWLGKQWNSSVTRINRNVVLFQKPARKGERGV